jgi:hypothetical protein
MRRLLALLCLMASLLTACGGGGGGSESASAPQPERGLLSAEPGTTNLVRLESGTGDPVGGGRSRRYTNADAGILVEEAAGTLTVRVLGDEHWEASFTPLLGGTALQPGTYPGLRQRFTFEFFAGMDWRGEPGRCNGASADLVIDSVSYNGRQLVGIELRFEQQCSGAAATLRGQLRWRADDPTRPPGPLAEAPAGTWAPGTGAMPAAGNAMRLEAAAGERITGGYMATLTPDNATFRVDAAGDEIAVTLQGERSFTGRFRGMSGQIALRAGYYGSLRVTEWRNPARGGLHWYSDATGCQRAQGWFVIDEISFAAGELQSLSMRFEQRCDDLPTPLRGALRWSRDDRRLPPGPQPVPAGLWQPDPAAVPASGNFVLLDSEGGDWVGQGMRRLITDATADLILADDGGRLTVLVGSRDMPTWRGFFYATASRTRMQPGFQGRFVRSAYDPTRGSLRWSGEARGCELADGWFVVDRVSHTRGLLRAIELRFEQLCKDSAGRLRGLIRWTSPDPVLQAGPEDAPPPEPTPPPEPVAPASGNHLLVLSTWREFIGGGTRALYTPLDAGVSVSTSFDRTLIFGAQARDSWTGQLRPPGGLSALRVGRFAFVSGLTAAPAGDADVWDFYFSGRGRACDSTAGWIEIHRLERAGDQILAIELSFEQSCDGSPYRLRGQFRYDAADTRTPPRPTWPVPAELWSPPPGATPDSGNFLYLDSPALEFVGGGERHLLSGPDTWWSPRAAGNLQEFVVAQGGRSATLTLNGILGGSTPLEAGYYAEIRRPVSYGSARGGIALGFNARGCNDVWGWMAIDAVEYDADGLRLLDMRFEQQCDDSYLPLRGRLRWQR